MPAQRKRAGKRPRERNAAAAKVVELAFRMEEPLNEALDSVQALHLMGDGLTQLAGDEEGRAVAAVARAPPAGVSIRSSKPGAASARPPCRRETHAIIPGSSSNYEITVRNYEITVTVHLMHTTCYGVKNYMHCHRNSVTAIPKNLPRGRHVTRTARKR